jgi:hypothetical protein
MYGLCALTSVLCAWFWGGLFFGIQAVNNGLLVIDKLVVPDVDYSVLRFGIALGANMLFLYGLILRSEMD